MEVYKAIANVAGELAKTGISKDGKNQQQGFMFRGIDAVYNHLAPLLAKHQLVILPRCVERECVERLTAKGGNIFYVTVKAEFDFVSAIDASKHTVATFGEAMDSADKATNKAMSAAYKYAAFQSFCIPTEETAQDADATTYAPTKPAIDITPYLAAMDEAKNGKELAAAATAAWEATNDDRVVEHHQKILAARKAAAAKSTSLGEQG